jgi:hypothetical protein
MYSLATVSSTDALFDALHGQFTQHAVNNKLLECIYVA